MLGTSVSDNNTKGFSTVTSVGSSVVGMIRGASESDSDTTGVSI